jgi:hypothetical protein
MGQEELGEVSLAGGEIRRRKGVTILSRSRSPKRRYLAMGRSTWVQGRVLRHRESRTAFGKTAF